MPIEQMNISLSPQMARFIRGKVKKGDYTNASEVVRDAVRHMQEAELFKKRQVALTNFAENLTEDEQSGIRNGVQEGMQDIDAGRYQEYDAEGLRGLAKELIAAAVKKPLGRSKPR